MSRNKEKKREVDEFTQEREETKVIERKKIDRIDKMNEKSQELEGEVSNQDIYENKNREILIEDEELKSPYQLKVQARPINRRAKREKEEEKGKGSGAPLDIFQKINPKQVQILYMITILALLFFSAADYYTHILEYLDYGAEESMATFFSFLIILYVLAVKFYFVAVKRVVNIIQLAFVFLIPSFFVEMALETYVAEAKNITVFDHWYDYYYTGNILANHGELKKAEMAYISSLEGIDKEDKGRQEILFFKSQYQLAKIILRLGEPAKAFDLVSEIIKSIEYFRGSEKIEIYLLSGKILNKLGRHNEAFAQIALANQLIEDKKKIKKIILDELKYEYLISYLKKGEGASGLTEIKDDGMRKSDEKFPSQSDKELMTREWSPLLDHLITNFKQQKVAIQKKESLSKINNMGLILVQKNYDELALETYKKYLELVRETKASEELIKVYRLIAQLYDKGGDGQKAQVYYDLIGPEL